MQTRVWGWRENSVIRVLATQVKGPEPGSPVPRKVGWDGEPLVIPAQTGALGTSWLARLATLVSFGFN